MASISADVMEAPAPRNSPQIAYRYEATYTVPDDAIARAQAGATALCAKLGNTRCIIVKTSLNRTDDWVEADVDLLVAAALAPRFNRDLDAITAKAGGETSARSVEAEDLTKQLIDTAARIRAKQALADRLLALLRNADGKVADLVAAERAYADVQEELDAARTLNGELSRRVAMSRIDINYRSAATTATLAPLHRAGAEVTGTLASSAAALLTFVVAAIPWVLLLALITWITRRVGWRPRWPFRRRRPLDPISPK